MKKIKNELKKIFNKGNINKKVESLNISNSAAIVFHHISYLKNNSN